MPASRAPARLWRLGTRVRPAAMPAYERAVTPHPPRPDAQALEEAVKLLQQAHRPVVVAGGGTVWSGAFEELRRLADELHIPVLTTASGRGSIDERHPLATHARASERKASWGIRTPDLCFTKALLYR